MPSPKKAHNTGGMFREVADAAPDSILLVDKRGCIRYANPQTGSMFGYGLGELKGKPHDILVPGRFKERHSKKLADYFSEPRVRPMGVGLELRALRKDGSEFPVEISLSPLKKGRDTFVICIARDITERKKAEEIVRNYAADLEKEVGERTGELRSEKEKVEALLGVKDEFIRNITHELKTPLSVLLMGQKLLTDIAPIGREREWAEILDMMKTDSGRLAESIDKILQLSRIGTAEIRRERVYVDKALRDIHDEYLPLANSKGIGLKLKAETAIVIGDFPLIRLALSNLVSNAIKFTESGSVAISMSPSPKSVSIEVADTGIGISPENQKRLFERFFKADPSAPGTGIGLALVKEIANKHKGSITVKSELGKGSTFTLTIPRGAEK